MSDASRRPQPDVGETILIGRRLREVRAWRGLSQRTVAGLAGISKSQVSLIERGEQAVDRQSTLEGLAGALGVAPSELTGQPFRAANPEEVRGHAAVNELRGVLRDINLGRLTLDTGGAGAVSTPAVDDTLARFAMARRALLACDYATLGQLVPDLLRQGYAAADTGSGRALLVSTLRMGTRLAKNYGHPDVAWSAACAMRTAAEALGDEAWLGVAQYTQAGAMPGPDGHAIALNLISEAADAMEPDDGRVGAVYGMLRLRGAFEAAMRGDAAGADDLLDEVASVAERTGESDFADLSFGPSSVRLWRVGVAVEAGDSGRVPELAEHVHPTEVPVLSRRGAFHSDVGRALASLRGREEDAVEALRQSELTTPQQFRLDPYIRETVGGLLRRARPGRGWSRELRGIAYRLGISA